MAEHPLIAMVCSNQILRTSVKTKCLTMDKPAIYRVSVRGMIDPDWRAGLQDLNHTEESVVEGVLNTVMVGRFADQAALSGLLTSLYNLHLPIVSVECLAAEE